MKTLACDKCGPMEGELGSQVVLFLKDVVDRCLPCQQGISPCRALRSSSRHALTIVAPGGSGAADTQVRRLRTPYSDVARRGPEGRNAGRQRHVMRAGTRPTPHRSLRTWSGAGTPWLPGPAIPAVTSVFTSLMRIPTAWQRGRGGDRHLSAIASCPSRRCYRGSS